MLWQQRALKGHYTWKKIASFNSCFDFFGPTAESISGAWVGHLMVICEQSLGDVTSLSGYSDHLSGYNHLPIIVTTSSADLQASYYTALILSVCLPTRLGSSIPQRVVFFWRGDCEPVLAPETQKGYQSSCGLQIHLLQQGLNSNLVKIYSSTFVLPRVLCFRPKVLYRCFCLSLHLLPSSTDS